jgi:hypothetical protein
MSWTESVLLHRLADGQLLALLSDDGKRLVSAVYDGQSWQYDREQNNELRTDTLPFAVASAP